MIIMANETRAESFYKMLSDETDDCILWPYGRNTYGYGVMQYEGRPQATHRVSCLLAHGDPPSPRHTDAAHSCRNRHCFNPRHLRWATRQENLHDMLRDGTSTRGSKSGHAKLTEQDVLLIREQVAAGVQQKVFAEKFGVHAVTISSIVTRRNWQWLDPDHQTREVPSAPPAETD